MKTTTKLIAILCVLFVCVSVFTPMADAAADPYSLPVLSEKAHSRYCLSAVKDLQMMLNYVNKAGLSVDGYFGPNTTKAVKNFQRKNGLSVDGVVGKATWTKLFSKIPLLQTGSSNNMVKLVQQILNRNGYNCGQADGIFGTKTYTALKKFQTYWMGKGEADGIVGPKTWKMLIVVDYYDFD